MKNIIVLLAGLMFAGTVYAGDMTTDAEFRLRWQMDSNQDGNDSGSQNHFEHRAKIGAGFKANDQLSTNITLMHNNRWGAQSATDVDTSVNGATPSPQVTNDNGLVVNEAYLTWQVSDDLKIKAGRGAFELADGSVIAKNDFQQTMTAFDGVAAVYEMEMFRLTGFGVRFADFATNAVANAKDPEANSVGASFDFKSLPDFIKSLNVHVMQNNSNQGLSSEFHKLGDRKVTRYGVTIAGDFAEMFDYRLTYGGETGDMTLDTAGATAAGNPALAGEYDVATSMLDAEFAFSMPDMMNMRAYVGYHTDSGNDGSSDLGHYDSFYYDIHKNAGFMDSVKWGNLTYLKLGATMDIMEGLNMGLHYHMFTATEKGDSVSSDAKYGTSTGDDEIGNEIDVELTKTYDSGLMVGLSLRQFMLGDRYGTNREDHQQIWFQTKMNF